MIFFQPKLGKVRLFLGLSLRLRPRDNPRKSLTFPRLGWKNIPDASIHALSSEEISTELDTGKLHLYDQSLPRTFIAALKNKHKYSSLNNLDKAKSPRLQCMFNNEGFTALIDSGAEVNVLDKYFTVSLRSGIINTTETALAANKLPLELFGHTAEPL